MQFAAAARVLGEAARRLRLLAPSFRSPPRVSADRTVRGQGTSTATVAVRVRGRPWLAVLADLVEGVVVANRLRGPDADTCRTELWAAVEREQLADLPARESRGVAGLPNRPREAGTSTVDATPGWRKRHTQAA